jgi:hypothetical protein
LIIVDPSVIYAVASWTAQGATIADFEATGIEPINPWRLNASDS